eukprot:4184750-Prymnesium_polylepis.1
MTSETLYRHIRTFDHPSGTRIILGYPPQAANAQHRTEKAGGPLHLASRRSCATRDARGMQSSRVAPQAANARSVGAARMLADFHTSSVAGASPAFIEERRRSPCAQAARPPTTTSTIPAIGQLGVPPASGLSMKGWNIRSDPV